jgi:hypothetical protein
MSRTPKHNAAKTINREYWKSRLHKHGETRGTLTKKWTHRAERRSGKKETQE